MFASLIRDWLRSLGVYKMVTGPWHENTCTVHVGDSELAGTIADLLREEGLQVEFTNRVLDPDFIALVVCQSPIKA